MTALFTRDTTDFLTENKLRNDKTWFTEHRKRYEDSVVAPLVSMAGDLAPALHSIDDKLICLPKVGGSVSRIWRDARFSKDKSLFRDTMWCMFVRQKNMSLPEFFFVVHPGGFLYGCGYYSARTESMESVRKMILSGDRSFKRALSAYEKQNIFVIDGDMFKRSRYPGEPENIREWLDRKSISFIKYSDDFELLYSEQISSEVADGFKTLAPVYDFLIEAEARKP